MKSKSEIATYYAKKYTPKDINAGTLIAFKAIDAFSELPISVQSYWRSDQPTKEEYCLRLMPN